MTTNEIHGWFDFAEVYDLALQLFDEGIFVEVGSWQGKSSCYMASKIAESNKPIDFFCVDTWEGTPGHVLHERIKEELKKEGHTLWTKFLHNISSQGVADKI